MEARALWIITQDYAEEMRVSAMSVEKRMPGVKTVIVWSTPENREHKEWFVESVRLLDEYLKNVPDDTRLLWLDSDTYMVEPVPELLEMLDNGLFDLAMAHAPGRRTAPTAHPVPDCFPEFNIGVCAMKVSERVRKLWEEVYRRQTNWPEVFGDNDQAPLRESLYNSPNLRVATLPQEYNCRFNFGCQVRDRVKILHGRGRPWTAQALDAIAAEINLDYEDGYQVPPHYWLPGPPRDTLADRK